MTLAERLWNRVRKSEGCWEWTGRVTKAGYGQIWVDGKLRSTHRISYELAVGSIPAGLEIDHLCRNRICVRPDHLRAVTPRENVLASNGMAARNAAKTHCINGHEFSHANTYIQTTRTGKVRICRACNRLSGSAHHRKHYIRKQRARKLTAQAVQEIRTDYKNGTSTHRGLAMKYGVSRETVRLALLSSCY